METAQNEEIKIPQPDDISNKEKGDAMGAYFMMFASLGLGLPFPLLNLIAAVIYYYVNKKDSRYVGFHSLQSLLSQMPVTILNAGVVFWLIYNLVTETSNWQPFAIYAISSAFVNFVYFVISIIAAVEANKGVLFYMPLFGRIAFSSHYGEGAKRKQRQKFQRSNTPPKGYY